ELLAWLTLNPGKHAGNQPARVAQLDHGNDRAILVQGDEGSAQVVWLGHRGTPSRKCSDEVAISSAARPIASFGSIRVSRYPSRQGRGCRAAASPQRPLSPTPFPAHPPRKAPPSDFSKKSYHRWRAPRRTSKSLYRR